MELVGVVRCPLASLVPYGHSTSLDVPRLVKYFERYDEHYLDPEKPANHVSGIVTTSDLYNILDTLQLDRTTLLQKSDGKAYPLLSGRKIAYINARHRLAAAYSSHASTWWIVKLFHVSGSWAEFPLHIDFPGDPVAEIQDEADFTSHRCQQSDGELYTMIRKYMKEENHERVAACRSRLSKAREISLNGLLNNLDIVAALDNISLFPGLIAGLRLSVWHKHDARHIPDHIISCLRHIYDVWMEYIDGQASLRLKVDPKSVKFLQFRAPRRSHADRAKIRRLFSEVRVFPDIDDIMVRGSFEQNLLSKDVVIPSMEYLHQNMKYVSIGAQILELYVQEIPRTGVRPTLRECLFDDWKRPPDWPVSSNKPIDWAYLTIFVAALRLFPNLTSFHPRQDIKGETMPALADHYWVHYLLQLVSKSGFDNAKIQEGLRRTDGKTQSEVYRPLAGPVADWRCGIPFTKTYFTLRSEGFLSKLVERPPPGGLPNPAFILWDLLSAFFDISSISGPNLEISTEPVHLDSAHVHIPDLGPDVEMDLGNTDIGFISGQEGEIQFQGGDDIDMSDAIGVRASRGRKPPQNTTKKGKDRMKRLGKERPRKGSLLKTAKAGTPSKPAGTAEVSSDTIVRESRRYVPETAPNNQPEPEPESGPDLASTTIVRQSGRSFAGPLSSTEASEQSGEATVPTSTEDSEQSLEATVPAGVDTIVRQSGRSFINLPVTAPAPQFQTLQTIQEEDSTEVERLESPINAQQVETQAKNISPIRNMLPQRQKRKLDDFEGEEQVDIRRQGVYFERPRKLIRTLFERSPAQPEPAEQQRMDTIITSDDEEL